MKIAVTYDNETIFQHFGKTQFMKLYDIEDGTVKSSAVYETAGASHEQLADWLKEQGAEAVICGGIGQGAIDALAQAGIKAIPGASGSCDDAVKAYLAGDLTEGDANCAGEEASDEGDEGCEEECGHNCAGCHHHHEVIYPGKNAGKLVSVHYRGTFNDGSEFDSSYSRNEPLEFICGTGMMIPGFDKAVLEMNVGDEVKIHLNPADAYGEYDPSAVIHEKIANLPGSEDLTVGERIGLVDQMGRRFPVTVTQKDDETITLDANHEMAGKELNFEIKLLSVTEQG